MAYTHFVGIDLAAQSATVSWRTRQQPAGRAWTIAQHPDAYARLVEQLRALAAPATILVVMEATSTYWLALARHLHQAGFAVSVVNPSQPHHFAKLRLQHTKTDAVDARLLADFACQLPPPRWIPPPPVLEHLRQSLALREDLLKIRTQQRNRLHALQHDPQADPVLLELLHQQLAALQAQLDQVTAHLTALLYSDHPYTEAVQHVRSIPGLGLISTAWIVVATQAFARCTTPEQAAAFAGLAPHARDSGTSVRGQRSVGHGGHKALRDCLYMAAGVAARFNPGLRAFYERLVARGKAKKVARLAVARKLIHLAWALVVKQQDFDPHYAQSRLTT